MDITLHKLDQIRKLLREIEEHLRPDPEPSYVWDGTWYTEWPYPNGGFIGTLPDPPSGAPAESIDGGEYKLDNNIHWDYPDSNDQYTYKRND